VLAIKVGLEWREGGRGGVARNTSRECIMREVEDSLRRLGTDYIDLYQVHWPDSAVPMAETAEAMGALYKAGKIRAIGVSNFSPEQCEAFRAVAPIHTVQPPYNLFEREIERDILPYARAHRIAIIGYGALCRGLLSGRMRGDTRFEGDDLRKLDPKFQPPRFEQYPSAVAALDRLARERHGKSVLALAIRWLLQQTELVALWGARHPRQLDAVEDAFGWSLTAQDMAAIDEILRTQVAEPVGPQFMAPPIRRAG
jgi:aryl-alcohol dehydrogenase-like predicted oxidoreductase